MDVPLKAPEFSLLLGFWYSLAHYPYPRADIQVCRLLAGHGCFNNGDDDVDNDGYDWSRSSWPQLGRSTILDEIYALVWAVPEYAKILMDAGLANFDFQGIRLEFNYIKWENVNPEVLLQILVEERVAPATFRSKIEEGNSSYMHSFADEYFRRKNQRQHWRALASWIFNGARLDEISFSCRGVQYPGGYSLSPLLDSLARYNWGFSSRMSRFWLEDLAVAGVDLEKYGERESALFVELRQATQASAWGSKAAPYGFTYGPSPEDWYFFLWSGIEGYAGEFWQLVEPVQLEIPGAWFDEDSEWI